MRRSMGRTNNNCARDGKVHVLREKCDTCIFRPGNLMRLRPGRVKSMVDECLAIDGIIPCHETLEGKPKRNAVCRGFFDLHFADVFPLRLAVAMNRIEEDEVQRL